MGAVSGGVKGRSADASGGWVWWMAAGSVSAGCEGEEEKKRNDNVGGCLWKFHFKWRPQISGRCGRSASVKRRFRGRFQPRFSADSNRAENPFNAFNYFNKKEENKRRRIYIYISFFKKCKEREKKMIIIKIDNGAVKYSFDRPWKNRPSKFNISWFLMNFLKMIMAALIDRDRIEVRQSRVRWKLHRKNRSLTVLSIWIVLKVGAEEFPKMTATHLIQVGWNEWPKTDSCCLLNVLINSAVI